MKQEELNKVLELHKKWLNGEKDGVRADLYGADLTGANLSGADLYGADLSGANLSYADLYRANLSGANLSYADLYRANLSGANLYGADLSDVNLYRTNLYGADLSDVNLYRTNLSGAENYYSFTAYDTSRRLVHCVRHETTWMIQAGCFWGSLEELEAKVKETHNSKVYLANIEILKGL